MCLRNFLYRYIFCLDKKENPAFEDDIIKVKNNNGDHGDVKSEHNENDGDNKNIADEAPNANETADKPNRDLNEVPNETVKATETNVDAKENPAYDPENKNELVVEY